MTNTDLGDGSTARTVHLTDAQLSLLGQSLNHTTEVASVTGLLSPELWDQIKGIHYAFMVAQMGAEAAEEAYARIVEENAQR